ncbi:MAG: hypothetical protein K2J65_07125 [Duncaniella sp.]|nr:hypothetical protein [Duncaniella sp.]
MPSTLCHAAVINGEIHRRVIVSYDSADRCRDVSITPFECEIHSTDDFNGAILVLPYGADFDLGRVTLAASSFHAVLEEIAFRIPHVEAGELSRLLFLPL